MAAKKKTKTEDERPEDAAVVVTVATVKTAVRLALEKPSRGVPVLIGPPQWGKTHLLREMVGELDRELVMCNPQGVLPEDLQGWPARKGLELKFTQPAIFTPQHLKRNDWALFVDELDKASGETLSAMLTLFDPSERRLRHTRLPKGVLLMAAMNPPVRPLPEPLVARMLMLPWPPPGWNGEGVPEECSAMAVSMKVPEVPFPERPTAPGALFKLREWYDAPEFWEDQALQSCVVNGLFPAKDVPNVLVKLKETPMRETFADWARKARPIDVARGIYPMLMKADLDDRDEALKILSERANEDKTQELVRVMAFAFLHRPEDVTKLHEMDDEGINRMTQRLLEDLSEHNALRPGTLDSEDADED